MLMRPTWHGRVWRGLLLIAILPHLALRCADAASDSSCPIPVASSSTMAHYGRQHASDSWAAVHQEQGSVAFRGVSHHARDSHSTCCELRSTGPVIPSAPALTAPTIVSEAVATLDAPNPPFGVRTRWTLAESSQHRPRYLRLSRLLI